MDIGSLSRSSFALSCCGIVSTLYDYIKSSRISKMISSTILLWLNTATKISKKEKFGIALQEDRAYVVIVLFLSIPSRVRILCGKEKLDLSLQIFSESFMSTKRARKRDYDDDVVNSYCVWERDDTQKPKQKSSRF